MKAEALEYRLNDVSFRGHLAFDEIRAGKRPGVLVVHEAWGLGEQMKQRAERLAQRGYAALAVDMVGDGKQFTRNEDALQWAGGLRNDLATLRPRIRAAYDALAAQPQVDRERIAAIGHCIGGTIVLELARSGAPVAGVVSFHGNLTSKSPAQPQQVRAKILVCTGADDHHIPMTQVNGFVEEMSQAGADFQVIVYGGTKHSFTNPRAGERGMEALAYNALTDQRSWSLMLSFFDEIFGAP